MTPTHARFGTGNAAGPQSGQPSFGRVFMNGVLLGLGWMTALGIVSLVKKSWNERDNTPISDGEE